MRDRNNKRQVNIMMTHDEYDNLRKNLQGGHTLSSFIRLSIKNEIERLETYKKEKNQTWDIE